MTAIYSSLDNAQKFLSPQADFLVVQFLNKQITVGICAYNEGNNIGRLLKNILHEQELSADSEVLVVCSGCTDETFEKVREYAAKDSRVKATLKMNEEGKPQLSTIFLLTP